MHRIFAVIITLCTLMVATEARAQWAQIDSDSNLVAGIPLWQLFEDQADGKVCIQETMLEECTYNLCSGQSMAAAWAECLKALRSANPDCLFVVTDLAVSCPYSHNQGRFLVAL